MQLLWPTAHSAPDIEQLYAAGPAPCVRLGMVGSLDGAASVGGLSAGLSGPPDRRVFRVLRGQADVVLVGAGTARAEGYRPVRLAEDVQRRRTARGQAATPPVAVVSRSGHLSPGSPLSAPAAGTLLLTVAAAPAVAGVETVVVGEHEVDLRLALTELRARGLAQVLCEGGPTLAGALSGAGLLDELCLTTSPVIAGRGAGLLPSPEQPLRPAHLVHLLFEDGFQMARWRLRPP